MKGEEREEGGRERREGEEGGRGRREAETLKDNTSTHIHEQLT